MQVKISLLQPIYEEDPYKKFAEIHNVKREFWIKMFHTGYMWRNYTIGELQEYAKIYGLEVSRKTLERWVKRTEDYIKAQKVRQQGVVEVSEEFFNKLD